MFGFIRKDPHQKKLSIFGIGAKLTAVARRKRRNLHSVGVVIDLLHLIICIGVVEIKGNLLIVICPVSKPFNSVFCIGLGYGNGRSVIEGHGFVVEIKSRVDNGDDRSRAVVGDLIGFGPLSDG